MNRTTIRDMYKKCVLDVQELSDRSLRGVTLTDQELLQQLTAMTVRQEIILRTILDLVK
jgi:hypothetical protein